MLRSRGLAGSRAARLRRECRVTDYDAERAFAGADLLGIPLHSARLVIVFDEAVADDLRDRFPGLQVRVVPVGMAAADNARQPATAPPPVVNSAHVPVRFACLDAAHAPSHGRTLAERALLRARLAGADVELLTAAVTDRALREADVREADVIVALGWPPRAEPPAEALIGMAARRPVIVYETEATAGWPALDPQTWRPRGSDASQPPIVISIDPRDDEHSLMLTMRRLAADPALRDSLAAAGQEWWRNHATVEHAVAAWRVVLEEAAHLLPPTRPDGWPVHLDADGSEHARRILQEFGVTVDLF